MSIVSRERLQALLDESPFTQEYGLRIVSLGEGTCTAEVPFRPHYVRPGGVVPGFIYMMAADLTMWLAIWSVLGEPAELSVTVDMKTAFLSGHRDTAFLCSANVIENGERLIYGTASCTDDAGKIITHHTMTYIAPPKR